MERRRFSQTMASEWQTAFVSHKMSWCALVTAVKNYNKSPEKLQDFFFKTKTKCSRPRLHDPRPRSRLSFSSSRRLKTKTLVSRTTSLAEFLADSYMIGLALPQDFQRLTKNIWVCQWHRNRGFRRFNEPGPRAPGAPLSSGAQKNFRQDS